MTMADHAHRRSIPDIFADVVTQLTTLFGKEMALARAEVNDKISQAVGGLALVMIGAVLLIPAIVVLLGAAVAALENAGIAAAYSALMVGGVALLIGFILVLIGMSRLRAENLAPKRTFQQLQRDAAVAKVAARDTVG